jgi:hypothetical protein
MIKFPGLAICGYGGWTNTFTVVDIIATLAKLEVG